MYTFSMYCGILNLYCTSVWEVNGVYMDNLVHHNISVSFPASGALSELVPRIAM